MRVAAGNRRPKELDAAQAINLLVHRAHQGQQILLAIRLAQLAEPAFVIIQTEVEGFTGFLAARPLFP